MSRRSSRSTRSFSRGESFLDSQRSWPPAIERLSINEELAALAPIRSSYFFGETDERDFPHALTFIPSGQVWPKARRVGPAAFGLGSLAYQWHSAMAPLRKLQMLAPRRVLFCLRRKVRKEIMFALNIAGRRGVGAGKRWRRTENSNWRC